MEGNERQDSSSLSRAKRVFLINSLLCLGIFSITAFVFNKGDEESAESTPTPIIASKAWSLPELAYLKGEMQALCEHPLTMPPYEEEWAKKHAEQAIRRAPDFDQADGTLIPILVDEYLKAYRVKFKDYYDDRNAWEFGYRYGIKFNPDLHGLFPRRCHSLLNANRKKLEEAFKIPDEATWRLFCHAFDRGFVQGYRIFEEGVTVQSRSQEIPLFEVAR